jgi:hypothetical protein
MIGTCCVGKSKSNYNTITDILVIDEMMQNEIHLHIMSSIPAHGDVCLIKKMKENNELISLKTLRK